MKTKLLYIYLFLIVSITNISEAADGGAYRFPHPEFTSGYTVPETKFHKDISIFSDYYKAVILIIFIIAGFITVYKLRSRKYILMVILLNLAIFGFYLQGCICPIGLIQNISEAMFNASYYITLWYAVIFITPLIAAVFAGRLFCISGCPLGALQEILLFKQIKIPMFADRLLRFIPYFILGISVVFAGVGMGYIICRFDPYIPVFRQTTIFYMIPVTIFFLIAAIFISRPYCRYFCPYGVLLKYLSYLSNKKIVIANPKCVDCRLCENACPNNAIIPTAPAISNEIYEKGLKRIRLLIYSIPFVLAAAGIAGFIAGDLISHYHPDIQLYRNIQNESKIDDDTVKAFILSGESTDNLRDRTISITNFMRYGISIVFIIAAFLVMIDIIIYSRMQKNKEPYIDAGICYACGRCYTVCPVERKNNSRR